MLSPTILCLLTLVLLRVARCGMACPFPLTTVSNGASFNGIDLSVLSVSRLDKLNLGPNEIGRQRCDVPTARASTGVQQLKEKRAE